MAWKHSTEYRHYIRLYPVGGKYSDTIDLEEEFKCRYASLSPATPTDVKNVYIEKYAERSGARVYAPPTPAYDTSEITLTLRWCSDECDDVEEWSDKFFDYVSGKKLEYHDTFRPDKYWSLILEKAPVVKYEKLYGLQYKVVEYKFTNWGGKPSKTSQIPPEKVGGTIGLTESSYSGSIRTIANRLILSTDEYVSTTGESALPFGSTFPRSIKMTVDGDYLTLKLYQTTDITIYYRRTYDGNIVMDDSRDIWVGNTQKVQGKAFLVRSKDDSYAYCQKSYTLPTGTYTITVNSKEIRFYGMDYEYTV